MYAGYLSLQTQTHNMLYLLPPTTKCLSKCVLYLRLYVHCQSCVCSISMEIIRLFLSYALFTCDISVLFRDKIKGTQLAVRIIRQQDILQGLNFSQTCFWKVWSAGIWRPVYGRVVQDVSKKSKCLRKVIDELIVKVMLSCHLYPSFFGISLDAPTPKRKAIDSIEIPGITGPSSKLRFPEELSQLDTSFSKM